MPSAGFIGFRENAVHTKYPNIGTCARSARGGHAGFLRSSPLEGKMPSHFQGGPLGSKLGYRLG